MKQIFTYIFVLICLSGQAQTKPNKVFYIQPLGGLNPEYVNIIKSSVESFFGFACLVKPKVEFTMDILAESKTRYEAGKFIDKYHSSENLLILTEKDIAY